MDIELKNMVLAFRVTELQSLLAYAGMCRTGRKNELQARAMALVKSTPGHIVTRIRELYRSVQLALNQQPSSPPISASSRGSGRYPPNNPSLGITPKLYSVYSDYLDVDEKVLPSVTPPYTPYSSLTPKAAHVPNNVGLISMPICPDVRIKKLPFYEIQAELIKPTSLISTCPVRMQEGTFPFCLTPQQVVHISASKEVIGDSIYSSDQKIDYQIQVQLRFCLMDPNGEQTDNFPPSICIKVNGKIVTLPHPIPSNRPGVEPKRPAKPINVTNYVKLSASCTNTVGITWVSDGLGRGWVMYLYLVKKLTSFDLLQRLKIKGPRPSEYTKGMIKEIVMKDDGDCQIAMTSFVVSLACPLGKCRMSLPCRASTCSHLQCFDANLFLQMNEKKPTWTCPVCDKPTLFENLSIDGYFQEIINSLSINVANEIEVFPDGTWSPISVKKEKENSEPPLKRIKVEVQVDNTICLDDDLIVDDPPTSPFATANNNSDQSSGQKKKVIEVVDLTLSDSDDDDKDSEPPVTERPKRRPQIIVDESSSSSSSSSSSASTCSTCSGKSSSSSTVVQNEKVATQTSVPAISYPTYSSPLTLDNTSISPKPPEWHFSALNYKSDYNYYTHFSASLNTNMNTTSSYNGYGHGLTQACSSYVSSAFPQLPTVSSSSSTSGSSVRPSSPNLLSNPFLGSHSVSTTNSETTTYDQRYWDSGFPNLDLGTLDFGSLFSECEHQQQQSGTASASGSGYIHGVTPSSPSSSHETNNTNKVQSINDSENYYTNYWPYSCNEFTN